MNPSASPAPFDPDTDTLPESLDRWLGSSEPPPALLPLLVGPEAAESDWARRAVIALADGAAADYDLILADLDLADPALGAALGEANGEGVADVIRYGASLERTVRRPAGHAFGFLPAGELPAESARVLDDPEWGRLERRLARERRVLFGYAPAGTDGGYALAERAGAAVVLAGSEVEAVRVAGGLPDGCEVVAALQPARTGAQKTAAAIAAEPEERPEEPVAPVAADPVSEEEQLTEPGFVDEHEPESEQPSRSGRRVSPVLVLALLASLGLGVWALARQPGPVTDAVGQIAALPGYLADAVLGAESADDGATSAPDTAPIASPRPVETELPFSVALGSYQEIRAALDRVDALQRAVPDLGFYVSPVVVDSVLYYRVLAGPIADRAAARRVMDRLVGSGAIEARRPGAVRNTPWAYQLGSFDTRAAAEAQARELLGEGIPTYVVEVAYTAGPPRFRVYAGAYAGPARAEIMARYLQLSNVTDFHLTRRIGRPAG